VRPDYATSDRTQTVRIAIVTAPLPEGRQDLGTLFSLIARRYVNHHRDFIVKQHAASAMPPADACAAPIQGLLLLAPRVQRAGEEVAAAVMARLRRCRDGALVWEAEADGKWTSRDTQLRETTESYVRELGQEVAPYVPAAFRLLRATLDTLPRPTLGDEEVLEKIEVGD
jgi:probable lipoprotein (TIGR04455 family)